MIAKFTSNEKHNIRTMAMFIRDNGPLAQVIKDIKTGSNEYIVVAEHTPGQGLSYKVRKMSVKKGYIGTINIERITNYGIEYRHLDDGQSLPDSVIKAIMKYNKTLDMFMQIGENAFNK